MGKKIEKPREKKQITYCLLSMLFHIRHSTYFAQAIRTLIKLNIESWLGKRAIFTLGGEKKTFYYLFIITLSPVNFICFYIFSSLYLFIFQKRNFVDSQVFKPFSNTKITTWNERFSSIFWRSIFSTLNYDLFDTTTHSRVEFQRNDYFHLTSGQCIFLFRWIARMDCENF